MTRNSFRSIRQFGGLIAALLAVLPRAEANNCNSATYDNMRPEHIRQQNNVQQSDLDCVTNLQDDRSRPGRSGTGDSWFQQDKFFGLRNIGACKKTAAAAQAGYDDYVQKRRAACPQIEQAQQLQSCNQASCAGNALNLVTAALSSLSAAQGSLTQTKDDVTRLRANNIRAARAFQQKLAAAPGGSPVAASSISGVIDATENGRANAQQIERELPRSNTDDRIGRLREQLMVASLAGKFLAGVETEIAANQAKLNDLRGQQTALNGIVTPPGSGSPDPGNRSPSPPSSPGSTISGGLDTLTKLAGLGMMGAQLAAMQNQQQPSAPGSGISASAPEPQKNLFESNGKKTTTGSANEVVLGKKTEAKDDKTFRTTAATDDFGASRFDSGVTKGNLPFFAKEAGATRSAEVSSAPGSSGGSSSLPASIEKDKIAIAPSDPLKDYPDPFASAGSGGLGAPDSRLLSSNNSPSDAPIDNSVKDLLSEMDKSLSGSLFGSETTAETSGDGSVHSSEPDAAGVLAAFMGLNSGQREEAIFSKELQGISLFTRVRTLHERCLKKGCVVNGPSSNI